MESFRRTETIGDQQPSSIAFMMDWVSIFQMIPNSTGHHQPFIPEIPLIFWVYEKTLLKKIALTPTLLIRFLLENLDSGK